MDFCARTLNDIPGPPLMLDFLLGEHLNPKEKKTQCHCSTNASTKSFLHKACGRAGERITQFKQICRKCEREKKHLPVKEIGQEQIVRVTIIEKKPTFRN